MEDLIDSNLISEVLDLRIMDPKIDWSGKMIRALSKACEYHKMMAKRSGGDDAVFNKMSMILSEYLAPAKRQCFKACRVKVVERDEDDDDFTCNMPTPSKHLENVKDMMDVMVWLLWMIGLIGLLDCGNYCYFENAMCHQLMMSYLLIGSGRLQPRRETASQRQVERASERERYND